jgi:YD repeat-containing protein
MSRRYFAGVIRRMPVAKGSIGIRIGLISEMFTAYHQPQGIKAVLAYDPLGRQTQGIDADLQVTQTQYDTVDRATRATDPLGNWREKTQLTWGPGHQLLSRTVKNADGTTYQTVVHTRNALGQPTRIETRDGAGLLIAAVATTYDAAHRVKTVNDSPRRPDEPAAFCRRYPPNAGHPPPVSGFPSPIANAAAPR